MSELIWVSIEDGGVKCVHDDGDFDGALVTEARIVQGGNGLWTSYVQQIAKGRKRKVGPGRVAGKTTMFYCPGQVASMDHAMLLCETRWQELLGADMGNPISGRGVS